MVFFDSKDKICGIRVVNLMKSRRRRLKSESVAGCAPGYTLPKLYIFFSKPAIKCTNTVQISHAAPTIPPPSLRPLYAFAALSKLLPFIRQAFSHPHMHIITGF